MTEASNQNTNRQTDKTAYTRQAEAKLAETKAKLDVIKAKIKGAIAEGEVEAAEQLEMVEAQLDEYVVDAQTRIEQMKDASEDAWEELKDDVEESWENLSQSVKRVIDRFSSSK